MVKNNDKWDKKAKRQYMIKHGIAPPVQATKPKTRRHFVQNEFDRDNGSSSEEDADEQFPELDPSKLENANQAPADSKEGEGDESDKSAEEESELEASNDWRYRDMPPQDDVDDSDYGIDISKLVRPTKNQTGLQPLKLKKKDVAKLKPSELLGLRIGDNNNTSLPDTSVGKDTPHVKVLDEQEVQRFHELQEKTKKLKEYQQLKLRFTDEQERFKTRQKESKVLDLTDKDTYQKRLETQFLKSQRQTQEKIPDDVFEQDLNDLLGSSPAAPSLLQHLTTPATTDIDDLLRDSISDLKITHNADPSSSALPPSAPNPPSTSLSLQDEAFLDDLLS